MIRYKSTFLMLFATAVVLLSVTLLGVTATVNGQSDDGRLNCDEAAPVVLYCDAESLEVFWVADGDSNLILEIPYEDIDSISQPDPATRIGGTANGLVDVYVLDTWEIQVNVSNGDEMWVARWWDCPSEPAEVEVYSKLTGELLSWERDTCGIPEPEVEYCTYTSPYTDDEEAETGTAPCDELCEWEGGLWYCDDLPELPV